MTSMTGSLYMASPMSQIISPSSLCVHLLLLWSRLLAPGQRRGFLLAWRQLMISRQSGNLDNQLMCIASRSPLFSFLLSALKEVH